jgi:hypothetical protein
LSCTQESRSPKSEVQWIKTSDIQQRKERQSKLSDDQVVRVKRLKASLAEVDSSSLDKWIEDFEKDLHPEAEIRRWESIAEAYRSYCSTHALSPQGKQDVFGILSMRSLTSDEPEILRRTKLGVLTTKQAQDVMAAYKGEVAPITVQRK